nr:MAG TPA: leucine-rich repeat protein [Caudoviricetes sp.]
MAEYLTNTTDLTSVANAIRTKGGTTAQLVYPSGFVSAINAIETGGGGTPIDESDITFYDYDGTIVAAWTLAELATKTELPAYPSHENLTCQGWNWTLADLKSTNRKMNVGAMYITDDGKTRIYIHLEKGRTSPMLGVCPNGTVTVDWGDGTTPDTLTGTSLTAVKWTPNHAYATPGDYVIKLTVDGTMGFGGHYLGGYLLHAIQDNSNKNIAYLNNVKKVELGSGITSEIGNKAFYDCYSLKAISIPNYITKIANHMFYYCYSLTFLTIPSGVKEIWQQPFFKCQSLNTVAIPKGISWFSDGTFMGCSSLKSVTIDGTFTSLLANMFNGCFTLTSFIIPTTITKLDSGVFANCSSLLSITLPNKITKIDGYTFEYCYSLLSLAIPNGITSIKAYTFIDCYSMQFYDFSNHTSVPTLENINAFSNIPTDCQIRVPSSLVDTWKAATNWSTYADHIIGV